MTTALYRRYRPETFEDVIGQSHVTEPLMTALRKNKVSHAYLFSGPRGCGKTTSARILARCLNCAQGPTPTPCGQCESCRDLARDGAGSLDVIEMDAASHGGVDDARQLRERATFAPVRDRYKIFIIDEAHMVTRDGFNALLKIVEEPPEHIKFIFATTEPNKVLPTIRSRTHHYPFRLVPPEPLMEYLSALCEQEGVGVEPGVQAMVVRAGGGSVRDSLSVLDQLMAGTDQDEISYDLASSLLGYTHGALLDDVVDAFASGDAATVFRAVDRVIQTGQDPRRFVEDLLERFRDLVIVDAVPENAGNILHGTPEDQISRLRNQAHQMGAAELSRAADITNEALTEMVGATSPQLHLELLCARLLLPSTENTTRGVGVRVDRLERRLNIGRTGAPTGPLLDVPAEQPAQAAPDSDATAPQRAAQPSPPAQPAPEQEQEPAGRDTAPSAPDQSRDRQQDQHWDRQPEQPFGSAPGDAAQDGQDAHGAPAPQKESAPRGQDPAPEPDPLDVAQEGFGKFRGRQPEPPRDSGAPREQADRAAQRPAQQPAQAGTRTPDQTPQRPPHADESAAQGPASGGEIDMIRNSWTEIISALAEIHRVSWMTAMRGTPIAFDGSVLQLMFDAEGDRKNFPRFEPNLVQAIQQVIGVSCRVEAVGPGGGNRGDSGSGPRGGRPGSAGPDDMGPRGTGPGGAGPAGAGPRGYGSGGADPSGGGPGGPVPRGSRPSGPEAAGEWTARGSAQDSRPEGEQHDGGRATGPRPFPPQDSSSAQAPEEGQGSRDARSPQDRGEGYAQGRSASTADAPDRSQDEPAPDDSAEVTTWEVASIPTSDPLAAAPAGPDAPADPDAEAPESAGAFADADALAGADANSSSGAATDSGATTYPDHSEAASGGTASGPLSATEAQSAWEQVGGAPSEQPQQSMPSEQPEPADQAGPDEQPDPAAASTPSGPPAASRASEPDRPTPADASAADAPAAGAPPAEAPAAGAPGQRPARRPARRAQPARGEDPSPDPVVPASPYDDIPWPDEAPPEEEPPFEDPGFRGAPSRRAAAGHQDPQASQGSQSPGQMPPGPESGRGEPSSQPGRDDSGAPDEPQSQPQPHDRTAQGAQTPQTAEDDAPPEQWRPSAPAAPSAAPSTQNAAPQQAPAPRKQSFRERHAAHFAAAQQEPGQGSSGRPAPDLDSEATFSPSEDDEAVENTDQSTRALIERILGGRLLEEIPHQPGL